MRCAIWHYLYNFKKVKNNHGEVLILVKLQAKINTPPWVFFTIFKLYKWYQIAQSTTYIDKIGLTLTLRCNVTLIVRIL